MFPLFFVSAPLCFFVPTVSFLLPAVVAAVAVASVLDVVSVIAAAAAVDVLWLAATFFLCCLWNLRR